MSIIISRNGKEGRRLEPAAVPDEEYLQRYIRDNPGILPLDEIGNDLRLLVLAREFPTGSGPIDILGIDQHGDVYLIETKLYRNSDKRKVVAQVMDYGASIWKGYLGEESFTELLDRHVRLSTGESLMDRIMRSYGLEGDRARILITAIAAAIGEGRFRFMILMDHLHEQLKDVITFLNANSRFTVYGVEYDFYRYDDLEILIPKLYGAEIAKQVAAPGGRQWDHESFLAESDKSLNIHEAAILRHLVDWTLRSASNPGWGKGGEAYINPKFQACHASRALFSLTQHGVLYLNFQAMAPDAKALDVVRRIGERLRGIEDIRIPEDFMKKNPPVPIGQWGPHLQELIRIFEEELRRADGSGQSLL